MHQLILPLEELLADDMERSLAQRWWGIDWGVARGWTSIDNGAFWRYVKEILGEWEPPRYQFFDFDEHHFMALYDPELFLHVNASKPWLQLYLPYPVHTWRYADATYANTIAAIESELDRMRERCGMQPRFCQRVRSLDRKLLVGSARYPDPHDRFIYRLF